MGDSDIHGRLYVFLMETNLADIITGAEYSGEPLYPRSPISPQVTNFTPSPTHLINRQLATGIN